MARQGRGKPTVGRPAKAGKAEVVAVTGDLVDLGSLQAKHPSLAATMIPRASNRAGDIAVFSGESTDLDALAADIEIERCHLLPEDETADIVASMARLQG